MDFFSFVAQEWMLVTTLVVLIVIFAWRERIKGGRPLSTSQFTQLVNQGEAVVIDVREGSEFKAGHIVGAINIPYIKIVKDTSLASAHKGKTLILVDKMGQHAGAVGRALTKEGYEVRRLGGGILEWQAQSLPLVKGK